MSTFKEQLVLGLMSGTSLDGLDLALCRFYEVENKVSFELLSGSTVPYPNYLKDKLNDVLHLSPNDLHSLDLELGAYFATCVNTFLETQNEVPELISSHGHTVLHQPDKGITLQIGDGDVIAKKTGIVCINDFRIQDVSKGGQGAPLVPIGDRDLFSDYDFCLNLGGIANISFDDVGRRIACDIAPCNMALNTVAGWVDKEYDKNGALASRGAIDKSLLNELNSLAYYKRDYPKSLGKEWFLHEFLPVIRKRRISIEDLLRTLCEHIAFQITEFTKKYKSADSRILLTGGGTHNLFLTLLLKESAGCEIVIPSSELINYKEAIVFAYLGFLRMANKVNVLSSVTGASSNTSAGIVYLPNA